MDTATRKQEINILIYGFNIGQLTCPNVAQAVLYYNEKQKKRKIFFTLWLTGCWAAVGSCSCNRCCWLFSCSCCCCRMVVGGGNVMCNKVKRFQGVAEVAHWIWASHQPQEPLQLAMTNTERSSSSGRSS